MKSMLILLVITVVTTVVQSYICSSRQLKNSVVRISQKTTITSIKNSYGTIYDRNTEVSL